MVLAANNFGRFFTGQITAAGKVPPAKVTKLLLHVVVFRINLKPPSCTTLHRDIIGCT